jgi:hypothetical protein
VKDSVTVTDKNDPNVTIESIVVEPDFIDYGSGFIDSEYGSVDSGSGIWGRIPIWIQDFSDQKLTTNSQLKQN